MKGVFRAFTFKKKKLHNQKITIYFMYLLEQSTLHLVLYFTIHDFKIRDKISLRPRETFGQKIHMASSKLKLKKKKKKVIQPKNSKINNPYLWLGPFQTSLFTNKTKTNLLKKSLIKKNTLTV